MFNHTNSLSGVTTQSRKVGNNEQGKLVKKTKPLLMVGKGSTLLTSHPEFIPFFAHILDNETQDYTYFRNGVHSMLDRRVKQLQKFHH